MNVCVLNPLQKMSESQDGSILVNCISERSPKRPSRMTSLGIQTSKTPLPQPDLLTFSVSPFLATHFSVAPKGDFAFYFRVRPGQTQKIPPSAAGRHRRHRRDLQPVPQHGHLLPDPRQPHDGEEFPRRGHRANHRGARDVSTVNSLHPRFGVDLFTGKPKRDSDFSSQPRFVFFRGKPSH